MVTSFQGAGVNAGPERSLERDIGDAYSSEGGNITSLLLSSRVSMDSPSSPPGSSGVGSLSRTLFKRVIVMRCQRIIGGGPPGDNPDVAENQAANEYQQ